MAMPSGMLRVFQQQRTGLGRPDAGVSPVKQQHPERFLQVLDPLRQKQLRHVQTLCRAPDRSVRFAADYRRSRIASLRSEWDLANN
jgi:hypothetical protein